MSSRLPWFKFYPSDWLTDPELNACSPGARAFWIDALCLLHEMREVGVFKTNGISWTDHKIAAAVRGDTTCNLVFLRELLDAGVAVRAADGSVFSRRMVRDESKRAKCSEAGKRGGGSPTFKGQPKGENKGAPKVDLKVLLASDSDSSSESSVQRNNSARETLVSTGLQFVEFRTACTERGVFDVGEKAWSRAAYAWRDLDFEQRLLAVKDIRVRDPNAVEVRPPALPNNYLDEKKWQRPRVASDSARRAQEKLESSPTMVAAQIFVARRRNEGKE
jgi:hypothetical protein